MIFDSDGRYCSPSYQHWRISVASSGLVFSSINGLSFWRTIFFLISSMLRPSNGTSSVYSSHRIMPKLNTSTTLLSEKSLAGSLHTSAADHCEVLS